MDYDSKYANARIPRRFWGLGLDFYRRGGDKVVADVVDDYLAYLPDHRSSGEGLLFVGQPGRGKTLLGCAVLQVAIQSGYSALYLTMPHLINLTHKVRDLGDAWRIMRDEGAYTEWIRRTEGLDSIRNEIDFVMLDDVGKEYTTTSGYSEALFDEIFRTRFDNSLPTIVTSNLAVERWEGRYSESMKDFINEACMVVPTSGQASFRYAEG